MVQLTDQEVVLGFQAGGARFVRARRKGRTYVAAAALRPYVANLAHEIVGALGEIAYAKHADLFWSPTSGLDGATGDVGPVHVRASAHPHPHLFVNPHEVTDSPKVFALVAIDLSTFTARVCGQFVVEAATLRTAWWRVPPVSMVPSWWIPEAALSPVPAGLDVVELSSQPDRT